MIMPTSFVMIMATSHCKYCAVCLCLTSCMSAPSMLTKERLLPPLEIGPDPFSTFSSCGTPLHMAELQTSG